MGTSRVAATHWSTEPGDSSVAWHRVDLEDGGRQVGALIAQQQPSAVINAAYVQGGPTLQPVTADAPGVMAAACADVGSRFVHVSTDVVFDGTTERPYREDDPTCPMHD